MEFTGLILEMLLPGALVLYSAYIAAWEFKLLSLSSLKSEVSGFVVVASLVFAYLLGIVIRHFALLRRPAHHYCVRIQECWQKLATELMGSIFWC
jgi:hypothetical protein